MCLPEEMSACRKAICRLFLAFAMFAGGSTATAQPLQPAQRSGEGSGATPTEAALYVESGIRHSARSIAFSRDGRLVAAGSLDRTVKVWDLNSGREIATLANGSMSTSLAFFPSEPIIAASGEDGSVQFWDVRSGKQAFPPIACSSRPSPTVGVDAGSSEFLCADWATASVRRWDLRTFQELTPSFHIDAMSQTSRLSVDGSKLTIDGPQGRIQIIEVRSGSMVGTLSDAGPHPLESIDFAPRSGLIAGVREPGGPLALWSWRGAGEAPYDRTFEAPSLHGVAFSADEQLIGVAEEGGDIVIVDPHREQPFKHPVRRLGSYANRVEGAGVVADSSILAVHVWYDGHMAFDLKRGGILGEDAPRIGYNNNADFSDTGALQGRPFRISKSEDRITLQGSNGQPIGTLVVLDKIGSWVAVDPKGRFDTNMDLSDVKGVHWVAGGNLMEPLPLEILMRDYYQPRLLPRLLTGASLSDLPSLTSLNRVLPNVEISSSVLVGGDMATVRVKMAKGGDPTQNNNRTHTDVYDLRLFRDGELVGQWPEAREGSDEKGAWRLRTHVEPDAGSQTKMHDFLVKLPTGGKESVTFTAYAFNEDRVKSATASLVFALPHDVAPRERRAYVIAIGANSYDAEARQLRFAVRDAKAMRESLSKLDGYKVVPVTLTSEGRDPTRWFATKANIRAVLSGLAGKPIPKGALVGVEGADRLARVTPDDLVIITFSGHGYTSKDGGFYLLPADSGEAIDPAVRPNVLSRFISSEELSSWLRPIDAGQMAMIIDACHSAASVDQPGFKPGPMGDRGLGQLAYDKAMRILAASQADDVALESEKLNQGLLTYALVHDGLALGPDGRYVADANHDGKLTLAEWLRYGEQHTPALFEDIRTGRKDAVYVGRDSVVVPGFGVKVAVHAQTPSLFDFARQDLVTLR